MNNTSRPRFKRSSLERDLDCMLLLVLIFIVILVVTCAIVAVCLDVSDLWYLHWVPNQVHVAGTADEGRARG